MRKSLIAAALSVSYLFAGFANTARAQGVDGLSPYGGTTIFFLPCTQPPALLIYYIPAEAGERTPVMLLSQTTLYLFMIPFIPGNTMLGQYAQAMTNCILQVGPYTINFGPGNNLDGVGSGTVI